MMHMTFYWGIRVTILFDSWRTDSWLSYGLSLLALFLVSVFYQYMEDRRIRFKILSKAKPLPPSAVEVPLLFSSSAGAGRVWSPERFASAVLFGVNSAIGYLLMLAVMSFNGGVFIAIVFGLAVGYLVFRGEGQEDLVALENPCACS
ncbi:copper transporter 5.1-like [Typha latifolia]|uniref:copper transporter 5.1-like n=1 Tax=Typha latifolia TaxID=4733 RepID=UPI003C2D8752